MNTIKETPHDATQPKYTDHPYGGEMLLKSLYDSRSPNRGHIYNDF